MLTKSVIASLLAGVLLGAAPPERRVENNVITSTRDPSVRIQVPASAKYVGADRWNLFSIADCELHAFVDADKDRQVQRLYWIQFEQYLPDKPDLHHRYDSPRHATLGDMDFYVDTWIRTSDEISTPGSDGEHIRALVGHDGYKMPPQMMGVRLVHLLDEAKRKELMIMYAENLTETKLTAADLREGGPAHDQWSKIEDGLIKRARAAVVVRP